MSSFHVLPRLSRFLVIMVLIYTVLFSLARLAFWLLFDKPNDPLTGNDLLFALYLGLKFDLRLAVLMMVPLFVSGWIRPLNPLESRSGRRLWYPYLVIVTLGTLLFYIGDFGHYAYLSVRTDYTILRFLDNPQISAQMVWQSYPVIPWALAIIGFVAAFLFVLNRLFKQVGALRYRPLHGWRRFVLATLSGFVVLFAIYGKISWYPLRWSDAFFSNHVFAAPLAANPLLYFYDTYRHGGTPYDEKAVREHYADIADFLGVDSPNAETLDFSRSRGSDNPPQPPLNVVVVILESMASYKTSLSHNPLDPSPVLAQLASEGVFFPNFFTPTTGTARGVFNTVNGLPDVDLNDTSSRNPTIVDQHFIASDYRGYEKYYFLGGSASWRNIRAMLANNIPSLHIYEEGSYQSPRVDVWGISDLDLFREADKVFRQEANPFFAIIQTSAFHRPFTIPEDNAGFVKQTISQDVLDKYGFQSPEEYNSMRFVDHSIGEFMKLAERSGYRDNTIFAFFGDHGINDDAGIHSPRGETQLGLGMNRTPFIIYAPRLFSDGRVVDTVASQTDVMATLAGLAGIDYHATTIGRDLFDPHTAEHQGAFIIRHSANTGIGVVAPDFFYLVPIGDKAGKLYDYRSDSANNDLSAKYPQRAAELNALTRGLYETSRYIINHNPHRFDGAASAKQKGNAHENSGNR